MRRKRSSGPASDEPRLDVSSLVDVSFLLLIFFLVTATIARKQHEITMDLHSPNGRNLPAPPMVRVAVGGNGEVTLGSHGERELVSDSSTDRKLPKLAQRIQLIQSLTDEKTPFQLGVSDLASHQRFIDVLSCFAENGVGRIQVVDSPSLESRNFQ